MDSSLLSAGIRSEVLLGLGSNMGDRLSYLSYAVNQLYKEAGKLTARSSVWESEPWGFEAEEYFLNMVVEISTTLDPEALLSVIGAMELRLGRYRRENQGYISRNIDIDILFWGEKIISVPGLEVPHPHIADRRFVLEPLNEIAADFIHPVTGRSVREMLTLCDDRSEVKLFSRAV
ncbi:MAG: 2-amino-4-hydroxy-6-hydroxymethyldihydropteridine diphosphokinase [Bacteroidales bacterium]|jgi:2-amino-4-hydroxy-6-hydroxymethyldihydropteridine diphosphokinase|nr:2-amino-4-hydroxy-6-hydroxymethyldihydropteridine diphosphokinase [Bacteroidales bacterium]